MGLSTLLLYRSHYRDARGLGETSPLSPIGVNLSCPRQAPPTVETPRGASPKRHRRSKRKRADRTRGGGGPIGRHRGDRAPFGISGAKSPPRRRPTGRLYSGGAPAAETDKLTPMGDRGEVPGGGLFYPARRPYAVSRSSTSRVL